MRNPRPIVCQLTHGPVAGKCVRVKRGQLELRYVEQDKDRVKTHVYRIDWPKTDADSVLQVTANYVGTRRR